MLCAVAPSIEILIAARLVQGLAGAVGIVIAQAAGRDLFSGRRLLRYYGRLTVLSGFAAIIGPVIGGQLARVTDWRGSLRVPRAPRGRHPWPQRKAVARDPALDRRRTGGLNDSARAFHRLLADRTFLGAVLITGFTNAAIFAYLSGATFVLQGVYGLSPQGYSVAFGLNSLGFMACGFVAGRVSERRSVHSVLMAGLAMVVLGGTGVLLTGAFRLPLLAIVVSLLVMVSGVAVTTPPATSLALENHADMAGTASSLLGLARFGFGAVAAPLVGIAGAATAVSLGAVTSVAALCAVGGYVVIRASSGEVNRNGCRPEHSPGATSRDCLVTP